MGHELDRTGVSEKGRAARRAILGRIIPYGAGFILTLTLGIFLAACSGGNAPEGSADDEAPATNTAAEAPPDVGDTASTGDAAPEETVVSELPIPSPADDGSYLLFNQHLIEGFTSNPINLVDPDTVFRRVFQGLPEEVTVFPSENYYYFILNEGGRQVWGNIRLPAGQRELGILSFGYFEFIEFPTATTEKFTDSKFFDATDGVLVTEVDPTTYAVSFEGKSVTFHLHELDQTPPAALALGPAEIFIQRTFDESGYEFYLIFNEEKNHFLWLLNDERPLPDVFDPASNDLLIGRRSGFAFWRDHANNDRLVLAGVRQLNIRRNDYYDGPFDQLADNYAAETQVAKYMQLAFPALEGRIDQYGYYTDREQPLRVALSTYYTYASLSEIIAFTTSLESAVDPYAFIASGGRNVSAGPTAVSEPDEPATTAVP